MSERIVLGYSGSLVSSAAAAWLVERQRAEVVTITLDLGQSGDLDEVRGRALACGATRAHVIDARDRFAREYVIPALDAGARAGIPAPLETLPYPLIARTILDVAAIEAADAVAHASAGTELDAELATVVPTLPVVAPARAWTFSPTGLLDYARARGLPPIAPRRDPHLLIRDARDPARAPDADAHVAIAFDRGVPIAINGVPMTLPELLDSLSLIAGQHGIGHGDPRPAPAAVILHAAYGAAAAPNATVRLTLRKGRYAVVGVTCHPELVTHT